MEKEIIVDDNRIIRINIYNEQLYNSVTFSEYFLNEGELYKYYTFYLTDDYCFFADVLDNIDLNEVNFNFDINHPLYFPFLHLLNGNEKLVIDDDGEIELNKKYIEVKNNNDKIELEFVNKLNSDDIEKFSMYVKNVLYDGRSKIDQQNKDTKHRLNIFFKEATDSLLEEYHQTTIEEYMVKQKLLKK